MGRKKKDPELRYHAELPKRKPRTAEGMEKLVAGMAYDYVMWKIANGIATSQETVEAMRWGSTKSRLERRILKRQDKLLKVRADAIIAAKNDEALYAKAMEAMKSYGSFNID